MLLCRFIRPIVRFYILTGGPFYDLDQASRGLLQIVTILFDFIFDIEIIFFLL